MTISTTVGTRLTIEEVCLMAYRLAGLRSVSQGTDDVQWRDEFSFAKTLLDTICDGLSIYGVFARAVSFHDVTLTSGDYDYDLPVWADSVRGPAMYIAAGQDVDAAAGETVVREVDFEYWQRLSSKNATGRPTLFYVHREFDTLQAWLWPTPDEAGTVRFILLRALADTLDGGATIDLERYWTQYIIHELAGQLAGANGLDAKSQSLLSQAAVKLDLLRNKASSRKSVQPRFSHPSPWNRMR